VPQRVGGVRAGRPMSEAEGYQPVDFSSLPVGPDFDLVDGMLPVFVARIGVVGRSVASSVCLCVCMSAL